MATRWSLGPVFETGHSSLNTTALSRGPRSFPSRTFGFAWSCRL